MLDFLLICVCYISSMSNFLFLKKNNENLFNIISEAEKLFRDEYFEQTMVQARRFAENLCKDLLQEKVLPDDTFDSMINKIKDNSFQNMRMKELADDLYFLKKHGNNSAHSSSSNKKEQLGKLALECLERAYEIAIFYSNIKYGYNKKLDKAVFSEELLMTGKITAKKSPSKLLKEKYSNELKKTREKSSREKSAINKPKKTQNKQIAGRKPTPKKKKENKNKGKGKKKFFQIFFVLVLAALVYLFLNING